MNKELTYLRKTNPELVKGCFVVCYGQTYYIGRKSTNRFEFNGTSKLDRMYYYRVREVDNSAGKSAWALESLQLEQHSIIGHWE